ncbi:hypothetical protein DES43_102119 [Aquamicrobium defluvii]|uniref:Uncharacterized protein n=1 Tax=Aquamicrobium defluvii TaxID=69279 RepID=A0A4R6YKR9_9HYPH|nr:hypothetical protein DES43_102119 [Aquamicrobium defluvii]
MLRLKVSGDATGLPEGGFRPIMRLSKHKAGSCLVFAVSFPR